MRVELRLNGDDMAVQALIREAGVRGVTLQQHIQDILIARFIGGGPPLQDQELEQQQSKDSASASADVWM